MISVAMDRGGWRQALTNCLREFAGRVMLSAAWPHCMWVLWVPDKVATGPAASTSQKMPETWVGQGQLLPQENGLQCASSLAVVRGESNRSVRVLSLKLSPEYILKLQVLEDHT
ncbi:unnamed protein product [Ostreobium quekettii]|uniref:Uncharacterized protein n=1 Tax=Ostreobium quekettii TaxID=121088 RepID=A0A8S1J324_9CHLO|nr:unnamed protein product [Ostreobium quekettii]